MKAIRVGICAVVAFSVAGFGGVEWWGAGIVEIAAASLFLLWGTLALRRRSAEITWNWLYLPMLGIAALAEAQTLFRITAYPFVTRTELLKGLAFILLCFLAVQSFRATRERVSLMWFLITLSFIVAVFGIVQHLAFNGKLYWLVALPLGAEPYGPFVDRDHFAGFVELTAPLGLAMLFNGAHRREKTLLLTLLTAMPTLALLLSGSRGGIIGLGTAILLLIALSPAQVQKKGIAVALTFGILVSGLAIWLGARTAFGRFQSASSQGFTTSQRMTMDRDTWRIVKDHPWAGTGLGTFETIYPRYASFYDGRVVDHAHNDYLEFLAETGILGGLLGAGFIALLLWRGIHNLRTAADIRDGTFTLGALACCGALLVHSLVDFNLHIPSNVMLFLLLAALACAPISAD